jgi:hypothetical protein
MSSYPVPVCLQLNINSTDYPISVTPINGNNVFQTIFYLNNVQNYNGGLNYYDLSSIEVGNWIAGSEGGTAWRISAIVSPAGVPTIGPITLNLEDVGNFNANIDGLGTSGYPTISTNYIYFTVSSDGLPVFSPLYLQYTDSNLPQLPSDIISIFNNRNPARQSVNINQASAAIDLPLNSTIWLNPATGLYTKSNNTNAEYSVGVVSSVGVPNDNWFTFKAFGTYYTDTSVFFGSTGISSFGPPGTFLYIDTSGINQYTSTPPSNYAVPIWVYLGIDPISGSETGLLYSTPI